MNDKFLKPYDSKDTESRIYKKWEESGYFDPNKMIEDGLLDKDAESFSIVLPPPNVTGVLHIGHAYEGSLQDAIIRYQRMRGKKTLWIPGTDSAAIATQARVEKDIKKDEGKSRHDLGRKELVERISAYAKQSESTILNQIKKIGASLDWSRYAYTLDEKRNIAVSTAFQRMFEAGLIYRSNRIVNWDPKGQTTISDDEIVYEERNAKLYTFKYSEDFPISISTTRPETKVGDTAVAVHPEDERYQKFIGQEFDLTFCEVPIHIKIVADASVEKDFGTGALGVTPAHSQIDWDIAEKNNLPKIQIINEYAKMMVEGRLKDKKTEDARVEVVEWLKENDLLEKEEDVKQNISTSERTGAIIEPLPKLQWWISVTKEFEVKKSEIPGIEAGSKISLKDLMKKSVESGAVKFSQENFKKIYFHWIDNLKDWCISRQIWFGHRIPIWYKDGKIVCSLEKPKEDGWIQEEDVLDTWFSSALWTFSTLGWPNETEDLATFHPTSFMSPAYEILPLWVSRMILMSGFHLGQVPFKEVLIHGLVRDKSGKKFSKSLKNGIDPLEMIEKYGADALRMGLLVGTAIGNDIKFDENQIRAYSKFANKIWNATRFVLEQTVDEDEIKPNHISNEDHARIAEFSSLVQEITKEFEEYKLYLISEKLYHYFWHTFADIIIEDCKKRIQNPLSQEDARSAKYLLRYLLINQLKVLHPFMPFITEEIWQTINKDNTMILVSAWPLTQ